MRRILYSLACLGLLAIGVTGCTRVHGVCDCYQIDPCCTRSPWFIPPIPPGTPPPPALAEPLPSAKKL